MRLFRRRPRLIDPAWDLHRGDVLRCTTADGVPVTVEVIEAVAPDETFDHLRLYAEVVDPGGLDLRDPDGDDSVVPVGTAAEPMALADLGDFIATVITPARHPVTPGLVVLVPEGPGADDEPCRAGFQVVGRRAGRGGADGYAVVLDWPTLARRLDSLVRPPGAGSGG